MLTQGGRGPEALGGFRGADGLKLSLEAKV
jgi:hypothetical protein